jgi:hypothetical protein
MMGLVYSRDVGDNTYRMVIDKYTGKVSFKRPKHKWENNTKVSFEETGYEY